MNFFTEARTTGAQKEKRKRVKFGPISDMETLMKVEAQYAVKTFQLLVYEKFSTELGPIHTLFFLPEYSHIVSDSDLTLSTDEGCTKKDGSAHEANRRAKEEEEVVAVEEKSEAKEEEIGMRCFVSTKIEGKLYNVCEPCELATYAYTNPTLQCCANDKFIYAVTDAEVDAFTLRTSLSAAEYDPVPPCLMGMKNFLGVCRVLSPGNFVVLLSKVKASETAALLERFRSPTKRTPMRPKRRLPRLGIVERENSDSEACGGGSGDGCGGDDNNNNDNDDGCASSICGSGDVDWNDGEEINWIMYSMHPYSLHMLYDDIIERVLTTQSLSTEGSATVEGADSQGYYQLVLEGHFLLQAKIVSLKRRLRQCRAQHQQPQQKDKIVLDIKAYSSLLRHSSGVLGDYFFRATKEYHKAAQCYSDSDRKLSSTVTMFLGAAAAREALVEYLDRVLFDTRMQAYADETTQLSDAILAYYAEYAPHRLSTVVVDSFLRRYTKTTALALLCLAPGLMPLTPKERRAKITELEKRGYSLTSLSSGALFLVPKDAMACVLTQLSLGMRDQAVSMLRRTDPSSIVDFCASYPQFLRAETPEKAQTHPLVCVLRDAAPLALLEIAVRLGNEAVHLSVFDAVADASMRKVLRVFYLEYRLMPHEKECVCESVVHLSDGPHLCHKVTTNSLVNSTNEHADELASLYLDMALEGGSDQHQNYDKLRPRNTSNNNNDNSSDCFDKWLEQHHKVFIESSPQWLKDLFDFACCDDAAATAYLTDDDDSAAEGSSSSSLAFSKFSVGNSTSSSKSSGYKLNIFYARKLVGLLCSGLLRDPTNLVERLREAAVAASAGATVAGARARKVLDVILALAAPLVLQQKKTFSELVAIAPGAALDFGMSFCDAPEDWKNILEALLPFCCGNGRSSDKGVYTGVVVGVYEDILEYTALLYEPAVFLRLLPSEGNLEFFERYIELSFRKSDSVVVRTEFMNLLRHTESENSHL